MASPASGMESQASGVRPQAVRRTIGDMTGGDGPQAEATPDPFVAHRGLLFRVAYEMLGSAADAEDAVQETWLRWANVDQKQIHDPRAYLARIVTRQALNRLRLAKRRREQYVGSGFPNHCSQRLTWPKTSSSPRASRSRCSRCSRPSVRLNGRCSSSVRRITRIYAIRNPGKLRWLDKATDLRRSAALT